MTTEWLDLLKEWAKSPSLLKEVYGDLAKPGVQQVGIALETVLGILNTTLLPLRLINERSKIALATNLERYREKMKLVQVKDVSPILPEIGVPLLEKLSYVTDTSLSEMYLNLLTKASSPSSANQAHPSFVNIVGNLSPDEALLLETLVETNRIPFLTWSWKPSGTKPAVVTKDYLTGLERAHRFQHSGNLPIYFSNLVGLGLLEARRETFAIVTEDNPDEISTLEATSLAILYEEQFEAWSKEVGVTSDQATKVGGLLLVTAFGRLFIRACHQE